MFFVENFGVFKNEGQLNIVLSYELARKNFFLEKKYQSIIFYIKLAIVS